MHKLAVISLIALSGCAVTDGTQPGDPRYDGVETRLLDGDLVNFHVAMRGIESSEPLVKYAECAAAQYSLIRGYSFAQHVRTQVEQRGGRWYGDAVYTISQDLPNGLRMIDAEVVVADCLQNDIPTV